MKFTGERVIPGEGDPDLFNEHRARYLFAQRFSSGKKVLDAACGSGYGSALLAENAQAVFGVDIEREAVEYARLHYRSPKLHFAQSDCLALPCPTAHFDLIVAFEIIEHLQDPGAFLRELRRVLHPAGILLLSTPNRLYYTEDRGEVNPFHHREFSLPEFQGLLGEHFPHAAILFQNHVAALLVAGAEHSLALSPADCISQEPPAAATTTENRAREAHFMVAVCSAQRLGPIPPLLYLPSSGNVLRERETHIHLLEAQLRETQQERDSARARFHQLEAELQERTQWALKLQGENEEQTRELEERARWALDLQRQLDEARAALQRLQQEFEERTAWALRLDAELNARCDDLRLLYGSRWYRIGKNLRMSPVPPSDQPTPSSSGQ
jgi:SAM-dependent methyltransferase